MCVCVSCEPDDSSVCVFVLVVNLMIQESVCVCVCVRLCVVCRLGVGLETQFFLSFKPTSMHCCCF